MNTCKNFLLLLIALSISSCHTDDVRNTYTIKGKIGFPGTDINTITPFPVNLISGDQIIATSHDKLFTFSGLEEGKSYIISPQSEDSRDGLSTLDRVRIEKYISGLEQLNPFQKLAADVNRDNTIDQADIDLLVSCIVGGECFSWRFASEDYAGMGTGYVDQYVISNLVSDHEITFIPVKLGDVNGTIH